MRLIKAMQHGMVSALVALTACGGGGSSMQAPAPAANGTVSIRLYPSMNDGRRLFVLVNGVGSASTRIPVAFDTGSAGLTLYAPDIFPASLVDETGFQFPNGTDSLSFEGITVTRLNAARVYGGQVNGRRQVGNLGFARVSFGDLDGSITTQQMPILFYYQVLDTATGTPVAIPAQHGWFGVNDNGNALDVAGSVAPVGGYAECSPSSTDTCFVGSVFKYVGYPKNVDAGFLVTPATLENCSIAVPGSCPPQALLTVGLTAGMKAGFISQALNCPPKDLTYRGPLLIAGLPACQAYLENASVVVNSSGAYPFLALFDSGTPYMAFSVPVTSNFPNPIPPGDPVTVTLASGFQYSYTAGAPLSSTSSPYLTAVVNGPLTDTIIGVDFFTTHSFYIDYSDATDGFK